ncbi:bifunctional phosphoribosylaminoimidazolecarboxamide formyltransferase/IMP cyclohydrolase [Glycomyces algeriensis]|uniref:Bifunctional purine biosynthesis protein PurH n=1 Tax=Glycomyces algeriensis TaxID=256037 RepID=A0A9W6G426_9ACTN|nr:bifunctional phosphoribosylaminoimidazolecarboxamide formyltransferase/IMP cyclohydrolase [Glycomyces algeriensis]MDA1367699.1 bifunctional phosphoribosylaminoimidazolecarboxamide formyltransferase/IMP cyclohydrolase [Glycomyces algeriensis]MDR7352937.1 phosphoribosylaminoimidazolecarboxamide formyltransferase/IMP cyclohydrolase [Glycomyces algeriensis]GLI40624.1 bifunctional purine biosynthesis protein PurH [Glycomyces algeriensis]
MSERKRIQRALISVFDKTGVVELAADLHKAGVQLVSTGSTAARISEVGIPVTKVEDLTGFPEILDDRVKTLHPKVHAGMLADVRRESHRQELEDLGIEAFDLFVGNLYPFQDTVASGAGFDDIVEKIDVGGPSMTRGAAKNHANVAVVVDPADYDLVRTAAVEGTTAAERLRLAAKAFAHLATYDAAVATWLAEQSTEAALPDFQAVPMSKLADLRYGENPHQAAAVYAAPGAAGLAQAEQLHGKAMSFNNYTDADAAWRAAHDFSEPCVAIIKHANPCGIAVGDSIAAAHRAAHECDPVSAFGGVIAANGEVDAEAAAQIAEIFTEVVVAPSFTDVALTILSAKKNIRLLRAPEWVPAELELKPISGGVLAQRPDRIDADGDDPANWTLATGDAADAATLADLAFAWRAVRAVKSNAILLASGGASVGVGMGQVNRVDSAKLAVERAGERANGSVASSDAFFPFADGLQILIDGGVKAVVQPGGSVRDEEVIAAAKEAGITMYLTGTRHFTH